MPALIIFNEQPEPSKDVSGAAPASGKATSATNIASQTRLRELTKDFPGEKFLFYPEYPNWNDAWDISIYRKQIQRGDTTGERQLAAFETAFEEGHDRVLFVGNDCPQLTTEMLNEASSALNTHEVVIGPATDGSIYLLGMKSLHADLFADKSPAGQNDWSGTSTLLQDLGLSCYLLKELPVGKDADDALSAEGA